MRKILSIHILVWVMAASCNSRPKEPAGNARPAEIPQCFLYAQGRDSIKLSLVHKDGEVIGKLAYLFYEKDKSMGTIQGQMRGDTLFVNYSFTAEGSFSTRELALLRKEDAFIMGSGEIVNKGNSDVFKDPGELDFRGNVVLDKIDCEEMGEAIIR